MLFKKRHTMKVKARAIYNEDKGVWEVQIKQKEFTKIFPSNTWKKLKTTCNNYEIEECDEFVVPWAILKDNGININKISEYLTQK